VNLLDSNNDYQVNAYFQSSSSASTGTQTVTLSSAEGNAGAQVFVTSITVSQVVFGSGTGNFIIQKDNFGPLPPPAQPVWKPSNLPDTNDAVGYVQGSTVTGTVVFTLNPSPPSGSAVPGVRIEGAAPGLGKLIANGVTIQASSPGASATSPISFSADTALPSVTKFYNPLGVSWSISANGAPCSSNCSPAGSTSGRVYVTLGLPLVSPVAETFVHLAASVSGAATLAQAFSNTWSLFSGPANVTTWNGSPLYYYEPSQGFNACAGDPVTLLTNGTGSGQCGSFALLFEAALAVNGIQVQGYSGSNPGALAWLVQINTLDQSTANSKMLISHWGGFNNPGTYPGTGYPWSLTLGNPDYMVAVPPITSFGDLTNSIGVPGQNTPTPSEKVFDFHFIVKVDPSLLTAFTPQIGPYFDPSYGVWYASAADFEAKAIAGYAVLDPTFSQQNIPSNPIWHYVVRQPSGSPNIYFSR
jgi:hypothetical protein